MSTTQLERESLEAHVDLCAIRYDALEKRLNNVEGKLDNISTQMAAGQNSLSKVIVGATGTIVAGLLSTIVVVLLQL